MCVCGCGVWLWVGVGKRDRVTERRGRGGSEHSVPHNTSPIQSIAHKTIAKFDYSLDSHTSRRRVA